MSDSQPNLEETLSKLSVSSKADETARINDWMNNSPIVTEPAPTNARSVILPLPEQVVLPATTIDSVVNPVTGIANVHTTTAPVASTSNNPPVMQLQNNTVPQLTMVATNSPVNSPVTSTTMTNVTAPPIVPTVMVQSQPLTVPASHVLPNLSAWTFPIATNNAPTSVIPVTTSIQLTPTLLTVVPTTTGYPTSAPVIPVTAGGTVYYLSPSSLATVTMPTSAPLPTVSTVSPTALPFTSSSTIATPQPSTSSFTVEDLAQLLMSSKKDHLPERKLAQYSGDPLQWHEWFGQFKSAIDSAPLTDDVKLTYLKTLVSGKAKTAIAEFAYCGAMYKDALKTLERKFGQPQTIVSAYLDKLANYPPVKMHNSDSIISYSATVSSLVGVFRSLNYVQDLSSASLLGQVLQKLPPNLKEAWSMNTVKRNLDRPTLIQFNDWLKEKAEAHERMKATSSKTKTDDVTAPTVTKTRTGTKVFAATTSNQDTTGTKPRGEKRCVACKENHPLWRCPVFRRKTPKERTKLAAESKLCFSCLNEGHAFRQCPQLRKCTKEGCSSSHNNLLHGSERIFPQKASGAENKDNKVTTTRSTKVSQKSTGSESSVCDVKGLLQIT